MEAKVWIKDRRSVSNICPNERSAYSTQNASLTLQLLQLTDFKMGLKFVRLQQFFVKTNLNFYK